MFNSLLEKQQRGCAPHFCINKYKTVPFVPLTPPFHVTVQFKKKKSNPYVTVKKNLAWCLVARPHSQPITAKPAFCTVCPEVAAFAHLGGGKKIIIRRQR